MKSVLLAVPTMGGIMKSRTAETLVLVTRQLTRAGIDVSFLNVDSSEIVSARNYYGNLILNSPKLDALLFVDSDMLFRPAVVMKMVALDVEAAAAAYPSRKMDMARFTKAMAKHGDMDKAHAQSMEFTLIANWNGPRRPALKSRKGFVSLAATGLGCALISRSVFETMVEKGVVEKRAEVRQGERAESWGFFDPVRLGDVMLGEDFSFWHRWTAKLKRELWVCVDEKIGHIGQHIYSARYGDLLSSLIPVSPAADDSD